ncbi:MAG: TrlF family AAA-like ATPase, partial [Planctomycetota bacterium]
ANKAEHFEAELTWESGGSAKKNLNEDVDDSALESVKYVPQAYLEKVCNELGTGAQSRFSQELKSVIFSHIDQADRLGYDDLDSLIGYRTKETAAAIELLRTDLRNAVQTVVRVEEKLSATYQKNLQNQLAMKKRELVSHEANKPEEITKPEADPATQEKTTEIEKAVAELQQNLTDQEEQIRTLNKQRATLTKRVAAADNLLARIANFTTQHQTFKSDSISDCAVLGLDIDSLVKVQMDDEPVKQVKESAAEELVQVTKALSVEDPESEIAKKTAIEQSIESRQAELDKPQQEYQRYLNALEEWSTKREEIIGDVDTSDTLKYLEAQVESLTTLPEELQKAKELCMESAAEIYEKIHSLAEDFRKVYQPVQRFIQEHPLAKDRFEMQFEAAIVASGFEDEFLAHISQGRKGSYCGQEEGARRIRHALREADFNTAEGIRTFLEGIERSLSYDLRQDEPEAMSLESQLRKGSTPAQLYEYLYSLDYLKPHYTLRWAGKDIEQLSPGERGTLLLVFYLLIDRSDKPLIMDQPEENLDNQTVYDILVPAIKRAKTRRQIIIVTHNPNLAVVCDSDQIIHASLDKDGGNRVTYTSGAIENPIMNQKVIDVLEGTRPAFHNREVKYHTSEDEPPK